MGCYSRVGVAQKERKRGRWQWGQEMARVGVWLGDEIAENGGSLEGEGDMEVGDVGGCRSGVGVEMGVSPSGVGVWVESSSSEKRAGASSVGKKRSMTSQSRTSAIS